MANIPLTIFPHFNRLPNMKKLTSQEMASHEGGRLKCVLLGIAAGALTLTAETGAGAAAAAIAWVAFIDAGC